MNTDCERARIAVMAQLDDEAAAPDETARDHVAACESCQRWLAEYRSVSGQLHSLTYPRVEIDLWAAVGDRLGESERGLALPRGVWPIVAALLAWRAIQLFIDIPIPVLHPIVPLAATMAAVWMVAADPLRIETTAPELRKRGA